jgi:hypothetical protein
MYVRTYVRMYVCMYVCGSALSTYDFNDYVSNVCTCMHRCMYACMYVCMCAGLHSVYIYICVCVCVCVCVCIYLHVNVCLYTYLKYRHEKVCQHIRSHVVHAEGRVNIVKALAPFGWRKNTCIVDLNVCVCVCVCVCVNVSLQGMCRDCQSCCCLCG